VPRGPPGFGPSSQVANPFPNKPNPKPPVNLRKFHWVEIPTRLLPGTLWAQKPMLEAKVDIPSVEVYKLFEDAKAPKKKAKGKEKEGKKGAKVEKVSMLDPKKSLQH